MADQREVLTDKSIARLCPGEKQYKVRDSELPGFFVLVGKRRKTFMAQGEFWRDGVREFTAQVKLGDFGDMTTRQARGKAKEALGTIAKGERPGEVQKIKPGSITLRQAWERYRDAHMKRKGRSSGTIESYRDHIERLFEDWLDRPLARLGRQPTLVIQRHDKITKESGPYIANGAMRSLRAVYNHARKSNTDLPAVNPVSAIDWNKEHRRNTGMGPNDISQWLKELCAMENPLRREFHLLTLFSGSRPTALKKVRIEHIDLRGRLIHIPRPKGGEEKAFDIPLSRPMIRCIIRAIRLGRILYSEQGKSWLFPAESEPGHLVEHKEERKVLSKWGNDLRQSYRTLAQAAGVSELDIHLLMNHSLPGVNAGYITRDRLLRDHLRQQQQRISGLVVDGPEVKRNPSLVRWLRSAKDAEIASQTELRARSETTSMAA
ncbi:integrase family protein [Bradyrhizobium sp. CCGUVB23]|uniref:tyrosine-type recombinase/integrase n=1 Tax=Bradyrhizobium sp. CCGUVB23 TaxID=2949630 RepID=UPI0020B3975B|nr:integrase family protein [Bradyrhizobium sp. CCGUVB23]MCP3462787.1 integrase family protein [Bradyrhizobium sp. CCGUVB23]